MKDIKSFILEGYVKGVFKKNDPCVIFYLEQPFSFENKNKVTKIENGKITKVVSKDVGRYSGDQHTWVWVDDMRFELWEKNINSGYFDGKLDKVKSKDEIYAVLLKPELADKMQNDNGNSVYEFEK